MCAGLILPMCKASNRVGYYNVELHRQDLNNHLTETNPKLIKFVDNISLFKFIGMLIYFKLV